MVAPRVPSLARHLAALGYGTRREVEAMLRAGRVARADGTALRDGDPWTHDLLRVDGMPADPPAGAVVLLHKPVGVTCSTRDHPPLVYALLPDRFLHRRPVMATVGRLDRDTSGLLLLTDDGALNHRLTTPRRHVAKVYEVTLAEPLRGGEGAAFGSGTLCLADDPTPLRPATLEPLADAAGRRARLTITEGRYHQVRRMFAAVGHHVVALHRSAFGPLALGDLPTGTWRVLADHERAALAATTSAPPPAP